MRPTCACGTCNKCKTRERMRQWRAENADHLRAWQQARYEKVKADPEAYPAYLKRNADLQRANRAKTRANVLGYQRSYYVANAERIRAQARERYRKAREEKDAKTWLNRSELTEQRELVRKRTRYAIAKGRLVRQPCEVCGAENTHAHHDDYSRELDVRWLCPTHHGEAHRTAA